MFFPVESGDVLLKEVWYKLQGKLLAQKTNKREERISRGINYFDSGT